MSRGLWSKCGYSQIVFCTISSLHISSAPCSLSYLLGCWFRTVLPFYSFGLNFDKSFLPYYNLTLHPAQSNPPCDDLPELSPLNIPQCTLWSPCTEPDTLAWKTEWANYFQGIWTSPLSQNPEESKPSGLLNIVLTYPPRVVMQRMRNEVTTQILSNFQECMMSIPSLRNIPEASTCGSPPPLHQTVMLSYWSSTLGVDLNCIVL